MKITKKYYPAQKVTEITYNEKVKELLIPMQVGSPEVVMVSIFSVSNSGWDLRLRTTIAAMPDRIEFIKSLGRSLNGGV
jgi:hypothetical protein